MKAEEVPLMLPDVIKPEKTGDYYIGCDYCSKAKEMNVMIFNKTTNTFEYHTKLFTTNKDDAMKFAKAITKYFNGILMYEI